MVNKTSKIKARGAEFSDAVARVKAFLNKGSGMGLKWLSKFNPFEQIDSARTN